MIEQILDFIMPYLSASNIVSLIVGFVAGAWIVGKLTAMEVLEIIKRVLPHIMNAEDKGLSNAEKKAQVVANVAKDLPLKEKNAAKLIFGGIGKTVETIFKHAGKPIIKGVLGKYLR